MAQKQRQWLRWRWQCSGRKHLLTKCPVLRQRSACSRCRWKFQQRIGGRKRLAPRRHRSVALGRAGRLCAGYEIEGIHNGVIGSDHPKCAVDLRLIPTAATERQAVELRNAADANCIGALPRSIFYEGEGKQILLMDPLIVIMGNPNRNEQIGCLMKAAQASGNDDRKRIPGPACSGCRLLELTHGNLSCTVSALYGYAVYLLLVPSKTKCKDT